MLKNRVISIAIIYACSVQVLMAESFNKFLNTALEQSPYLKSTYLEKEQLSYQSTIATRYENPDLDITYAKFNPKNEISDTGYSISISQPIRFWSINKDKQILSKKILKGAEDFYQMNKANFIKELSLLYIEYESNEKLKKLAKESFEITKNIYDISNERYSLGSISQAELLQTKVTLMELQIETESIEQRSLSSYYDLLKFAGVTKEIDLELNYTFQVSKKNNLNENPELKALESEQEINLAKLNIESNTFDSFNLTASYDNEPDQTVNRIGIGIPLPIFNNKSQERKIAILENKRNQLLILNRNTQLNRELMKLHKQRDSLKIQLKNNKEVLKMKNQLLEMYIEKYKISQASILELQTVKNSIVQKKKELIQTKSALNINAINLNYLQGSLNEKTITN